MNVRILSMWLVSITLLLSFVVVSDNVRASDGAIFYVGGSGSANYSRIQDAVDAASDGDTVFIYGGVYSENLFVYKSIDIIGENVFTTIIDGAYSGNVIFVNSPSFSLKECTIQHSGIPQVEKENFSNMTDSNESSFFSGNNPKGTQVEIDYDVLYSNITYAGIYLNNGSFNIDACAIHDCYLGIVLNNVSSGKLSNCIITNNSVGLNAFKTKNYAVLNSDISFNEQGLSYQFTDVCTISGCTISHNNGSGFTMSGSGHNLFYSNIISDNFFGVIVSTKCVGNIFYKNSFIDNIGMNVNDNSLNDWDYNGIGNYWDDYTGVDEDDDGIGDQVYIFNLIGVDNFPLMEPPEQGITSQTSVTISSPISGSVVSGIIQIKGEIDEDVDVSSINVRIDDGDHVNVFATNSWEIDYDVSDLSEGNHTMYVYVLDSQDYLSVAHVDVIVSHVGTNTSGGLQESPFPGFAVVSFIIVVFVLLFWRRK